MPRTNLGSDGTVITGDFTATCSLIHITRRDGQEYFLASHDQPVVYNGDTYAPAAAAFEETNVENREGTKVDEFEVTAIFDSDLIPAEEIARGLFNYSTFVLYEVYWPDPALFSIILERGRFGRMTRQPNGGFRVEMRSITERLQADLGRVMLPNCGADLGRLPCRVPIMPGIAARSTAYAVGDFVRAASGTPGSFAVYENRIYECTVAGTTGVSEPTWDTTVGNTTSDGSVTWKTYEAWTRHATIATVTDRQNFTVSVTEARAVDGWFNLGSIYFEDGNNAGTAAEIKSWTSFGSSVNLALELPLTVQVGDKCYMVPGCNRSRVLHCTQKFAMAGTVLYANGFAKWHFGFDGIPGRGYLLQDVSKTSEEPRAAQDPASTPWI